MIESALLCLTLNLYHEGRGEPIEGQIAINLVVLNRVKRNGTSPCKEIYKKHQFSWTAVRPKIKKKHLLPRLKRVVLSSLKIKDYTQGATHYHTTKVFPQWATELEYVGQWGNHLFYKESK